MAAPLTPLVLPAWTCPAPTTAPDPATTTLVPARVEIPERTVWVDLHLITDLLAKARHAATLACAPFSHFHVGAALIMADDPDHTVITGANVENSSLSLTQCAERTALYFAAAQGFRKLRYLAVSCAATTPATPIRDRSPCGSCRQVIREFSTPETLIFLDTGGPHLGADVFDVDRLLPHGFLFKGPPAS